MNNISQEHRNQSLNDLQTSFSNDSVTFERDAHGFLSAHLRTQTESSAQIQLQGAHLTSWRDSSGTERIFMSPDAVYQAGTPLRGGIPIIFPQFGPGEITSHGFARRSLWKVISTEADTSFTRITLGLASNTLAASFRKEWPHDFMLEQDIILSDSELTSVLRVKNTDSRMFTFTFGFHTYFAISDIKSTEISGFQGLTYMDQLREHSFFSEDRPVATISEHTDRRYEGIPSKLTIHDRAQGSTISIHTENCHDAFLWNPWQDGEGSFKDLTPNSYLKFVCVEPGTMAKPCELLPGEVFEATQRIEVS